MTEPKIDIEQERREFEAWEQKRRQNLQAVLPYDAYLAGIEAAKRAAMGSAEPVAMKDAPARIYLVIEDGGDAYKSFADAKVQADMGDGIRWRENRQSDSDVPYMRSDLAAPPAPVSAEPVKVPKDIKWPAGYCLDPNGAMSIPAGKNEDYNFGYDIGFSEAWEIVNNAVRARDALRNKSTPPSADAKDS